MKLMMDVVEYVRADDTPRDLTSFAVLLMEFRRAFDCDPFEIRLGIEAYLAIIGKLGGVPHDPFEEVRPAIAGVPVKSLPESYPNNAVMLVKGAETHAVGQSLDPAAPRG